MENGFRVTEPRPGRLASNKYEDSRDIDCRRGYRSGGAYFGYGVRLTAGQRGRQHQFAATVGVAEHSGAARRAHGRPPLDSHVRTGRWQPSRPRVRVLRPAPGQRSIRTGTAGRDVSDDLQRPADRHRQRHLVRQASDGQLLPGERLPDAALEPYRGGIRFFFNATPTTEIYTLSLHDPLHFAHDRVEF